MSLGSAQLFWCHGSPAVKSRVAFQLVYHVHGVSELYDGGPIHASYTIGGTIRKTLSLPKRNAKRWTTYAVSSCAHPTPRTGR